MRRLQRPGQRLEHGLAEMTTNRIVSRLHAIRPQCATADRAWIGTLDQVMGGTLLRRITRMPLARASSAACTHFPRSEKSKRCRRYHRASHFAKRFSIGRGWQGMLARRRDTGRRVEAEALDIHVGRIIVCRTLTDSKPSVPGNSTCCSTFFWDPNAIHQLKRLRQAATTSGP